MLLALASGLAARAAQPDGFPDIQLPAKARGEAAIAGLGNQIGPVAAFYHITAQELAVRLRRDNALWVDQHGRLFYVCDWGPMTAQSDPAPSGPVKLAAFPDKTFLLHSRPGSTKVIYLDFDGFDASTTSWGADAIGKPFDLDGDPTTFSASERTTIQNIWQRVAEDYALYDIDVTTEDPGVEALRKSNGSDAAYGIRVVIGGSSGDWFGSAGGVAFVGSFDSSSDTPCWVWPGSLANSEKNIAEAASHEVGHTLGLGHDGQDVGGVHTEYYGGQGNWAPIMGVGYSRPITQWSKGEYTNANNLQDDLAVMLTHGAVYRPDDYGNSIAAAFPLSGVSFNVTGNIERTADVDFFTFQTGAGRVSLTVIPSPRGANLHILLSLYDNVGNLLATVNPADTSSGVQQATLTTNLPTGVYYFSIEGIGSGDPVSTGYSDYASLGQYTVVGSFPNDSAWIPTGAGLYSWLDTPNWASNTIPLGIDAIARLNNNLVGSQVIDLNLPITLGQLVLGDVDGSQSFDLEDGAGGSLTFNSRSGSAFLTDSTGSADLIGATLILQTDLNVTTSASNSLRLTGIISGPAGLIKKGPGTLNLSTPAVYQGATVVAGGTLILDPGASFASSSGLEVQAGSLLDASALIGGLLVGNNQTLSGSGGLAGDITLLSGAVLAPGKTGTAGTLSLSNALTLNNGARLNFDLNASSTPGGQTNDLIAVAGPLTLIGTIPVSFNFLAGLPASPATYTLMTYSGPLLGGASNLVAISETNRFTYVFDDSVPGEIRVQVSGNPTTLVWHGDGAVNRWDLGSAANWFDGGLPSAFFQLDTVLFDDSGSNSPAISLQGTLRPAGVTINSTNNYSMSGSGKISGTGGLSKQGTGLLTVGTANDYSGPTIVSGGTLKPANASAFGSTNSTIGISNGATLDLSGFSVGPRSVAAQGSGLTGAGVILNSGATQSNAMQFVTLTGDATFGGPGRWDVRPNPISGFFGNGFKLTKLSTNEIWLVDVGLSGIGDIDINQGLLGFQASSTLGDPTKTLTLASNATVVFRNTDNNVLSKKVVLNDSSLQSPAGDNILAGTITLNGSNLITASNIFTVQAGISGPGGLTKLGNGILALTANNTYTGTTYIAAGTLQVRNSGALGVTNGGTVITTGGRLDINAVNLGAESVTVQGTGLGNAGAIINTAGQQLNALRFLTLSGNTSLGGIGRWDVRANPTAVINGNNFALTKTGVNEIWMVDAGASGFGTITVNEGLLGIQGTTTLGNSAATITVNSAGSLDFWANGTNILNKVMNLSGGRVVNGSGSNTFIGPVNLSGSNNLDVASGTTLVMAGSLAGSGSFRAGSPGTLILSANNTYTGPSTIASGVVQFGLGGNTGIPGSGLITNNATLTFHRNNTFNVANQIYGTGILNLGIVNVANPLIGSTLTLTANNQYTGNTVINGNGNFIAIATDTALGKGMLVFNGNNNGNSLTGIRSASTVTRNITNDLQFGGGNQVVFGAPGTGDLGFYGTNVFTTSVDKLVIVSNTTTRINNAIGNNSRLIKDGPGTLILGGNNTNGGLTINLGAVRIDSQNRLGRNPSGFTANHLTLNGGFLQTTATMAINDPNRGVTLGAAGGTFDVFTSTSLTLGNTITGPGSLTKMGLGTLIISAFNSYAGITTNLNGTTVLNGSLQGGLEVVGGTLAGTGTIKGPVTVEPGGALSPGISVGTLTISNQLTLLGTVIMEIDETSQVNDSINGLTTVNYGGTLNLNFLNTAPVAGDSFKIFDATNYTGNFNAILPTTPGAFLAWDTSTLNTDGTLRVVAGVPKFSAPLLSGGNLILTGTRGVPGGDYSILSSTNLGLPIASWTLLGSNVFDASGNFSFTNSIDPAKPQQFYLIRFLSP